MPRSKKSADAHVNGQMTLVRLDARKLIDSETFHVHLAEVFGFPPFYGKNLNALIDCLSDLDEPATLMTRIHVGRGNVLTVVIDGVEDLEESERVKLLPFLDAIAFVNARRIDAGDPPILAVAYP